MIRDFADFEDGATVEADVCVIGSGAAGITIATEFIATRFNVLLLESGGFSPEPSTQTLYDSDVVGLPHVSIHEGRRRVFGGTTTLWGGQALRLNSFEMQKRSWVPYSGWAISREALEPYYRRAEKVMHLGPRMPYLDLCPAFGIVPPSFDPALLCLECSQWSPKPNFSSAYYRVLKNAGNISVLLHANVTSIVTNQAASLVESIEFQTLTGKKGKASARFYVICCGGIETARLLLASDRVQHVGVGNVHDLVGRFFQEHIHIRFGDLAVGNRRRLQDFFESFYVRGLKYFPVVALSEAIQSEKQLLSIHGSALFDDASDSGIVALKQLFRIVARGSSAPPGEVRRLIGNALIHPDDSVRLAYRFYIKHRSGTGSHGAVYLGAQCEVAPNPQSRVLLGDSRDTLGMRKVKLDWRVGELERRTLSEYVRIIAAEFERLGLGSFNLNQLDALEHSTSWTTMVHDSAHHMGTTRMHDSPQGGVVDPNCQVHGINNLFIGSSSVFSTSARSNPTLTIIALCLRIADRLKLMLA